MDLVEKRINALETELKEKTEQLNFKTKEFNEQQECLKQFQERLNHENLDTCRQLDAYSLRLCNIFNINSNGILSMFFFFFFVLNHNLTSVYRLSRPISFEYIRNIRETSYVYFHKD